MNANTASNPIDVLDLLKSQGVGQPIPLDVMLKVHALGHEGKNELITSLSKENNLDLLRALSSGFQALYSRFPGGPPSVRSEMLFAPGMPVDEGTVQKSHALDFHGSKALVERLIREKNAPAIQQVLLNPNLKQTEGVGINVFQGLFMTTCATGDMPCIDAVVSSAKKQGVETPTFWNWGLFGAIESGDLSIVQKLAAHVDLKQKLPNTGLSLAGKSGNEAIIDWLFPQSQQTPEELRDITMGLASQGNATALRKYAPLADPQLTDFHGSNAMVAAAAAGHVDLARELKDSFGFGTSKACFQGLLWACANDKPDLVELFAPNLDLKQKGDFPRQSSGILALDPLQTAVNHGSVSAIQALLKTGEFTTVKLDVAFMTACESSDESTNGGSRRAMVNVNAAKSAVFLLPLVSTPSIRRGLEAFGLTENSSPAQIESKKVNLGEDAAELVARCRQVLDERSALNPETSMATRMTQLLGISRKSNSGSNLKP